MKFKIALTKDCLRETLMNIIESHSEQLNSKQEETFKGLLHLEKELSIDNQPLFCKDVDYALSLCVTLLSELVKDNILIGKDKEEFNYVCSRIAQAKELETSNHIEVGKLVTYDGLAYQVCEIDYDDLAVVLTHNDITIDVSPADIDNPKKYIDYIDHLKPIIDDLKDGEPKLSQDDVDGLMKVIRAKIELHEALICEEEYKVAINSAYD